MKKENLTFISEFHLARKCLKTGFLNEFTGHVVGTATYIYTLFAFQTLEGVSFAGNGITAAGIKAFDGILQSNIMLKTLDLSGNAIGDEGAQVSPKFIF